MERNGPYFNRDSEGAFGSESATRGGSFWTRIRWGKAVAAPGVRGQDGVWCQDSEAAFARNERKASSFARDSEGAFSSESATRGGESAIRRGSFWTRIRWGKAGVRGRMREKNGGKLLFFLGIPRQRLQEMEENVLFFLGIQRSAFGSESATRGGSFWTRIRWGKAVAASGVSGPGCARKMEENVLVFPRGSESSVWDRKCNQGRLVLDQN